LSIVYTSAEFLFKVNEFHNKQQKSFIYHPYIAAKERSQEKC